MRCQQGRFRKELGLSFEGRARGRLLELALRAGFQRAAFVDPLLAEAAARHVPPGASGLEWEWITAPHAWRLSASILVCCLSCRRVEPDDLGSHGDPHALVAPFARAHYYRQAVRMLQGVVRGFERETGVPNASIRLFSNSRLPEKPLLAATGLGAFGRNGCTIVPGLGSLFVIAGVVIPVPTPDGEPAQPPDDPCAACGRCRAACPVSAIERPYVVRRDLCLQAEASSLRALPKAVMEKWGARLYGCQECQAACPHNAGLQVEAAAATGEIGPSVSLGELLSQDAAARKERFRGTALGMSWVPADALLRNALVAAGNRGDPAVHSAVQRHLSHDTEAVRAAAAWALERL
jgi:epoxyqueuosine reductase